MRISDWSSDVCSSDLDGEVLLERALQLPGRRHQRRRRPAVDEEDDGVVAVLAADVDPLADAADPLLAGFLDAGRGDDALQVADDVPGLGIHVVARFGLGEHGRAQCGEEQEEMGDRSEEHTSELQSLMRNSYAVFCLKKKTTTTS